MKLSLQRLQAKHEMLFLDSAGKSKQLHHPWVSAPGNSDAFRKYLEKYDGEHNKSFLVINDLQQPVACINLNEIVRGFFQSAYLGYYVFVPFDGKQLMKQAMQLVIEEAFANIGLHRLEANIQPGNTRSVALVRSLGFRREGLSQRYLKINGEWQDHERYAITSEEWLLPQDG